MKIEVETGSRSEVGWLVGVKFYPTTTTLCVVDFLALASAC